jgi:hypothetical protein
MNLMKGTWGRYSERMSIQWGYRKSRMYDHKGKKQGIIELNRYKGNDRERDGCKRKDGKEKESEDKDKESHTYR